MLNLLQFAWTIGVKNVFCTTHQEFFGILVSFLNQNKVKDCLATP